MKKARLVSSGLFRAAPQAKDLSFLTNRFFAALLCVTQASVDKDTHACGRGWNAACRVIVLDLRQQACVLCLAGNAPAVPASPSEFFAEDKRWLARQTRQVGCRPPTRITQPDGVLPREKPRVPLSTDARKICVGSGEKALSGGIVFLMWCCQRGDPLFASMHRFCRLFI